MVTSVQKSLDSGGDPAALAHILVVDDDARIRALVCRYLLDHGFVALGAKDAAQASDYLDFAAFDALVVDIMMPGESGLDLTKRVRERFNLPVLLLTALGETGDRISGFEAGADDYLPKPFDPRELVLRLQAILRRGNAGGDEDHAPGTVRYRFENRIYEPGSGYLESEDGASTSLTDMEETLLQILIRHAGQSVSREDLAQGCGFAGNERSVDVQVTRLRKKLEADSRNPRILRTVRGSGYLIRAVRI